MNKIQYLLGDLIEELSEVIKELVKCQKFTCDHTPNCYDTSNFERACLELSDVYAVVKHLRNEGIDFPLYFPSIRCEKRYTDKFVDKYERVKEHMEISRSLGMLKEDDSGPGFLKGVEQK